VPVVRRPRAAVSTDLDASLDAHAPSTPAGPGHDHDAVAYARGSDVPPRAEPGRASSHEGVRPAGDSDARAYARAATEPPAPVTPGLPTPADAAFEAARIVAEMVDIDTVTGAAVAAAAAAGAAVEAAVARSLAAAATEHLPGDATTPTADDNVEPVITVRLNRDRVLRALQAEDVDGGTEPVPARAPSVPPEGGVAEPAGELDPLAIAAQAISRLRRRARTDLAELRVHYHRHDIVVVIAALVIIVIAGRIHASFVTPPTKQFAEHGLTFTHAATFLTGETTPLPSPRIAHDITGQLPKSEAVFHVELTSSVDPGAEIEVVIENVEKNKAWSNIVTGLELDRRTRWGELYSLDDSSIRSVADHDWLRTEYQYAHAVTKGDMPRVDHAIEYATIDRDQTRYVVTLFGAPSQLARLEAVVASSLRVATPLGSPLVPQTSRLATRTYPDAVSRAFESTVMVVVADVRNGRLQARGGGSGIIVGKDGSILTNYHVIHDVDGRLHDVFVIGRFSTLDHAPQLLCAGRPTRGKLQRDLDLALIKCDTDLDGRAWSPTGPNLVWPTLLVAPAAEITMGQRVWVMGYPDAGGGGLTLSQGEIDGWTGEDRAAGHDFIKTDAHISHGNSGGPVVDDQGRLVGVASAIRVKVMGDKVIETAAQRGLVRPLTTASDLLQIAEAGWTPREGHTDVDLAPQAVEATADGVRISSKVLDAANETPVRDALVMVLRPGVTTSAVDVNRLDDQVLAWGRSNTLGEVLLKQPVPVPGTYTVMIVARGYEPLIGENELHLDANTPQNFDPWGKIWLRGL
jgi:S1-C subfamily serine protease